MSEKIEQTQTAAAEKPKIFEKYKIKDIVFLAIISACALITCAVMPLVASLQTIIFGIAQLVTSLQLSIFFAIGLMKVRKVGSIFIMAVLTGLFQLLMSPPMFFSNIVVGLVVELIGILVFRGYKSDKAVFVCVMLYNPLSLPFSVLYNYLFGREAMVAVATRAPWITVVVTLGVIGLSALGSWLGIKISKELKKSGVMKK